MHRAGPFALWRDLLDGRLKRFPTRTLVPTGWTLCGKLLRPPYWKETRDGCERCRLATLGTCRDGAALWRIRAPSSGHRFLVTGDGLWLEARRPGCTCVPLVCRKASPCRMAGWAVSSPDLWKDSSPSGHQVLPVLRSLPGRVCGMDHCGMPFPARCAWCSPTEESTGCAHVRYRRPILGDDGIWWSTCIPMVASRPSSRHGTIRMIAGVQDCQRDRQLRSRAMFDSVSFMRQRAVPAAGIR